MFIVFTYLSNIDEITILNTSAKILCLNQYASSSKKAVNKLLMIRLKSFGIIIRQLSFFVDNKKTFNTLKAIDEFHTF